MTEMERILEDIRERKKALECVAKRIEEFEEAAVALDERLWREFFEEIFRKVEA